MSGVPAVSILLPVRDAAAWLPACLRSVERQTLRDFECIIVDDGSRDASLRAARATADRDARFRVIAAPRAGLVAALSTGLAECRGDVVARMDADDLMHRRRLELQLAKLVAEPELCAVGSHVRLFPRRALGPGMRAYERWLASIDGPRRVAEEAFVECPVAHPTLVVRRDVLVRYGYRDRGWPEDYDLVLRLLAGGHGIGVVPRRLLLWRHGPERLSQTHPTYSAARFTDCKAAFLADSFLAARDRYVLWGYGGTGKALCRALRARGKLPSAIVELHPGRLGGVIQGAPVISPAALDASHGHRVVVSVAGATARSEIRAELRKLGFRETRDYVCAA